VSERHLDKAHARIEVLEEREAEQLELRDQLRTMVGNLDLQRAESRRKDVELEHRHQERAKVLAQFAPYGQALLSMVAPGLAQAVAAAAPASGPDASASAAATAAATSTPADPAAAATAEDLIDQLFVSFEREQLVQIALMLRPEQQAILSTLYEGATLRFQRKRAAASSAAGAPEGASPSVPRPSDAAGASPPKETAS